MMTIRIGTRGSSLAVRQAEIVAELLQRNNRNCFVELVIIKTTGDKILDKTLDKIGGKGVFVKEIEQALLLEKIDIAVHSMKDMPAELPEGLMIGAVTKRENPMDAFVSTSGQSIYKLPPNAKIGTGSLRRKQQLLGVRSDIEILPIRGNINTRLKKMEEELDGIVLAAAGLKRCGLEEKICHLFSLDEMVPAACQGILALEVRKKDKVIREMVQAVNDENTNICQKAERAFLKTVGADCHAPVGAYAHIKENKVDMTVMYYSDRIVKRKDTALVSQAEKLGTTLGEKIVKECKEGLR